MDVDLLFYLGSLTVMTSRSSSKGSLIFFSFLSGQDAAYSMGASYDQQDSLQEADYTDDVVNLGAEGYEEEEGYNQDGEEAYAEEYNQGHNTEMDQNDYSGEPAGGEDGYQYEVLDIEIGEPIDGEFQVSSHMCLLLLHKGCGHILPFTCSPFHFFSPPLLCPGDNVSLWEKSRWKKIYSGEGDICWRFWAEDD